MLREPNRRWGSLQLLDIAFAAWGFIGVSLGFTAGCSPSAAGSAEGPEESASCTLPVWYRPSDPRARVELVASWTGWHRPGFSLGAAEEAPWRFRAFRLAEGDYAYGILEDGQWVQNPYVPTTIDVSDPALAPWSRPTGATGADAPGSIEATWVRLRDCARPSLVVEAADTDEAGVSRVRISLRAGETGTRIDPASIRLSPTREAPNAPRTEWNLDEPSREGDVVLRATNLPRGKHTLRVSAVDDLGANVETRASVWVAPLAERREDYVVYHVIVDRFRGDGGAVAAPSPASDWAGGNVRGLRAFVEDGGLESLGANVLWLSPLYKNPKGWFEGGPDQGFSAYHGYWPIDSRAVDERFGSDDEVRALVDAAHRRGIRVIFDVVPNHVHEQHPYFAGRSNNAGFHVSDPPCICGVGSCDWGSHIRTCWFAPYMPDVNWNDGPMADRTTEDVLHWLEHFDGDGLRIDAVPMMPRFATRRIAAEARRRFGHAGHEPFLLGENFTGPRGFEELRFYMGPQGLDSLFHFPLMWALRTTLAARSTTMREIAHAVRAGEASWRGSGSVMATFIDNHDVTRFVTEVAGDGGGDGFAPAPQPTDPKVYAIYKLAMGLVLSLKGVPVLYYGDEVALAGRRDPDSRRVMPPEAGLTDAQKEVRTFVARLARGRACYDELRRGDYEEVYSDDEVLAFRRTYGARNAWVVAARDVRETRRIRLAGLTPGDYDDLVSDRRVTLTDELTIPSGTSSSVHIFVEPRPSCASSPHPPSVR